MTPPPFPFRIGISFGKLSSFVDGLGEVSNQLGSRLAARAAELREAQGIEFCFHLHPDLVGCFGDEVSYLRIDPRQLRRHEQEKHFDVWHSVHQLNRYLPPAGTGRRITTVHDLNFLYFKNAFSRWRDSRRIRALLARTDDLVAISQYTLDDVIAHGGWSRPATVIYNGVRDLSGTPQTAVDGVPVGRFLFHLSRMAKSKNVEALLDMAVAWTDMPLLVLAGPDHRRNAELVKRVEKLRIGDRVRILDGVNDQQKAWLFAHCAGFVFPSLTEGFGLPPLEAMHFGKPVFVAAKTSLPEVCGDAAWYWHDFAPAAMRRVVEQGLADHLLPGRAAAVRQHALGYNWTRTAERYLALYLAQRQR
jgi:glycosyltransferase involved in cell wall biosynthesis